MSENTYGQLILSESVSNQPGMSGSVIANPFLVLFLPYAPPTAMSFGITSVLYFDKAIRDIKFELIIRFKDDVIFTTGEQLISTPEVGADKSNFNLNVDLRNIAIKSEGEYVADCLVDNKIVTSQKFYIYANKEL